VYEPADRCYQIMSHYRTYILTLKIALVAALLTVTHCARLGEAPVTFTEQNVLPAQPIEPSSVVKPGMGASGGPITWSFWVKTRTAAADAMLGSFTPFYKVNAVRLAVSTNFVLYRDSLEATLTAGQAASVLATMETAYTNLRNVYGGGEHPYANNNARVVILAYNIQDDYSTTGNYVGGYFSPRDLYSNEFTKALFTDPVALQQYSGQIGALGGYSNEMSIVHYDLNPGYSSNAAQVNDIVIHELSHLFTYSRRVITHRLVNHDLWIAEGIAENAPHATVQTANVQQLRLTQLASPSVIDYYQDAPQLTDFLGWAAKIVGYLQSNLFFNYLRHRAEMVGVGNGATFLSQLMTQTDHTIEGLDTLMQTAVIGQNFATLYGDFVITHYLSLLGIPIDPTTGMNGAAASQTQYSFSNVQIGSSSSTVNGTTIKSKYSNNIPFNFEGPKCADGSVGLKPNSYVIFRHRFDGGDKTTTNTAGATGVVAGELPLRYVINSRSENSMISATPPTTITLHTYAAGQNLPFGTGGYGLALFDNVHVIVYNPNKTGSCRPFDETLISKRNHTKWVGSSAYGTQPSPDFEWQSDTGAVWRNNQNGAYYRPGGIAAYAGGAYPNNFLYITDYNNMSVQRLNLDNGEALGRLGNTSTSCPTTGTPWSTNSDRYVNNFCAHTFDSPQGVHADSSNNVYVADSSNRRIVKYDSAGNFVGWIGLNGVGNDIWQGSGAVISGTTLNSRATSAAPRNGDLTNLSATVTGLSSTADLTIGMIVSAAGLPGGTTIASIDDASTVTLSAAATSTGTVLLTFSAGCSGYDPRMFSLPWSLTSDGTYLYVVDYGSSRIIRRLITTGAFAGYIGNGNDAWNSTVPTLACQASSGTGTTAGRLLSPRGVALAGGNLYIADEGNHRIVRVNAGTGASTGWLGHGHATWQTMATAPSGSGSADNRHFRNPSAVASDGTYLYVADRLNSRIVKWRVDGSNCAAPARSESYCGWIGHGKVGWENQQSAPGTDPYAGVSYYPPDYYAEPHGLALVTSAAKGTPRTYLFITSVYNGRVGRINLDCADAPSSSACDPVYVVPFP
jgi:hypothetical protein